MQPTPYPHVNQAIEHLLNELQAALHGRLIGVYLFGSLVMGDFDSDTSDIDLLAVTAELIDQPEFDRIHALLTAFRAAHPEWKDRIELLIAPRRVLETCKTETGVIAITSPGEAFHYREINQDWILNWYVIRERGRTLAGPPPDTIIEPITFDEFAEVVRGHLRWWETWLETSENANRGSQAYVILTMCRALYTLQMRDQASKLAAARWASQRYPEWASLIHDALLWRKAMWHEEEVDHHPTVAEMQRFVRFALDEVFG